MKEDVFSSGGDWQWCHLQHIQWTSGSHGRQCDRLFDEGRQCGRLLDDSRTYDDIFPQLTIAT